MKSILRLLPLLALCLYPGQLMAQVFFGTADTAYVWQDFKNQFSPSSDHSAVMLVADDGSSPATLSTADFNPADVCHWHLHFSMMGAFTAYNYFSLYLTADLNQDGSVADGLCVRLGGTNKKTVSLIQTAPDGSKNVLCESTENILRPNYPFSIDVYRKIVDSDTDNPRFSFSVYCDISNENVLVCQSPDLSIPSSYFSSHPHTAIEIVFTKTYANGKALITDFEIKNCEQPEGSPNTATDQTPSPNPAPEEPEPGPAPVEPNPEPEPLPSPDNVVCLRGDVVINEIMYHPSPDLGLPDVEWVELYNNRDTTIDLSNWTWCYSSVLPPSSIAPHGYVVLCPSKYAEVLSRFVDCPVFSPSSWPELNNSAKCLFFSDADNRIIDYIYYDNSAFKNNFKSDGGWSLERIDPMNRDGSMCNWNFSQNADLGATPGYANSVRSSNVDSRSPSCLYALMSENGRNSFRIYFSEPMDTVNIPSEISVNNKRVSFSLLQADRYALSWMDICVDRDLLPDVYYSLSLSDFYDLADNALSPQSVKVGYPDSISANDVIINEIMSKASPASRDYLELYNRSHKNIDLYSLCVASLNDDNSVKSLSPVLPYHRILFPGEYLLVTKDSLGVIESFNPLDPNAIVNSPKFPALPAEGRIAVSSRNGSIIDLCEYNDNMHSPLLRGLHNISLERINPNLSSAECSSWASASELCGYATPTSRNSQYRTPASSPDEDVEVSVKSFSPFSPDKPNCAVISTRFTDGSWYATLQVFSPNGYLIATPYNNCLLPSSGELSWNGLDSHGHLQPPGTYILYLTAWQSHGKTTSFKGTVYLQSE